MRPEPGSGGLMSFGQADKRGRASANGSVLSALREVRANPPIGMADEVAGLIMALTTEVAELRAQLGEAQELLIEMAVDAGELHGQISLLEEDLDKVCTERDALQMQVTFGVRVSPSSKSPAQTDYRGKPTGGAKNA